MLEAVRDWRELTGEQVGVKPAGGIRTSQGRHQVPRHGQRDRRRATGSTPHWFRFGASSLLNDLLLQRQKITTGAYSGADYVTID